MPAAVAVPLIAGAIAGGGSIAGAAIGSRGASKAAKTQADATDEAIKWEKQQYFDEQARLEPYRQMGGQAYARMGQMLGLDAPAGEAFSFRPQTGQAGATVKIRNPRTGEVRPVPAWQAEALKAKGGQVVP